MIDSLQTIVIFCLVVTVYFPETSIGQALNNLFNFLISLRPEKKEKKDE